MATYFGPNHVTRIAVTLDVTMAYHAGQHVRQLVFTDAEIGAEKLNHLADLLLSACDLAEGLRTHVQG